MATRMQQRRGFAAQWTAANPVLAAGEIGFETDTRKFKMGDGTRTWSQLEYFANAAELTAAIQSVVGLAPETLNTLSEIADALGDDPNFLSALATNARVDDVVLGGAAAVQSATNQAASALSSHASLTDNVHGIPNTLVLVTQEQLTTVSGATYTDAVAAASTEADSKVATAVAALTKSSVGLGNVDNTADANKPVSSAQASAISTAITEAVTESLGETDNKIADHTSVTTNVHGIINSANLVYLVDLEDAVSDHNTLTQNVHGIANTADLALKSDVAAVTKATIGLASVDNTADASKPVSTAQALAIDTAKTEAITAAASAADTKVSDHNLLETNVHGILDTSVLVTQTDLSNAITGVTVDQSSLAGVGIDWNGATEAFDIDSTVATKTYADNGVSTHNSATTSVHGISDTAQLAYKNAANQTFTGNMEVDGNVVVDGNLTVNGTQFNASSTSIVIEDNMLQLAHQNAANTVDLGIVVGYNDGANKHSGIVRDVSANKWKLFKGVTTEPSTTVDFTQGSLDDLQVGALEATTVTPSSGIVFSDGTQTKVGVPSVTTFATTISSSATLAAGEADKFVPLNGAVTITLPATGYSTGQSVDFYQATGTGAQFSDANGVVGTPGRKFRTTNSVVTAMKTATGWLIFGDLAL
jgi:hypothetical protein